METNVLDLDKDFFTRLKLDHNKPHIMSEIRDALVHRVDLDLMFEYHEVLLNMYSKEIFVAVEHKIAKSAWFSYLYALCVLKDRFLAGEKAIAKDSYYSYHYALQVVKGRFEPGEKSMAKSGLESLEYALYVLKDRFELGEVVIATNKRYSKKYQEFIGE